MISYLPLGKLRQFSKEFRLEQFKNIKVGTEGNSFLVPGYYKIGTFLLRHYLIKRENYQPFSTAAKYG